jgi:hypothetical protein
VVRRRRRAQAVSDRYPADFFRVLDPLGFSELFLHAARVAAHHGARGRPNDAYLPGDPDSGIFTGSARTQHRDRAEPVLIAAWSHHCTGCTGEARHLVQLADGILSLRIPGILCALAIMRFVREPKAAPAVERSFASDADPAEKVRIFSQRNIVLCSIIACLMVSWLMLHQMFLPLFFKYIRHFTEQQGSWIMGATGLCATLSGFIAAGISDRIGRKPVVVTACLLSLLTPLAALYFQGSILALTVLMFIGWIGTAAFALFMAVIPGETLPVRYVATATGLVACMGEIAGGGLQLVGGWIADLTTRAAPIQIAAFCALGGTILSLFLKETAPVKTGVAAAQIK